MKTQKAIQITEAIREAIKDAGQDGIPSGHLYAMLMGFMSLHTYQAVIDILVKTKQITNNSHLLKSL